MEIYYLKTVKLVRPDGNKIASENTQNQFKFLHLQNTNPDFSFQKYANYKRQKLTSVNYNRYFICYHRPNYMECNFFL